MTAIAIARARGALTWRELSAMWRAGPCAIERFEETVARIVGARAALAVPSARVGLELALDALGARGCEIVVSALGYPPLVQRLREAGYRVVLVDVGEGTLHADPAALLGACTPRTRALIVTHAFGRPAPMSSLQSTCARRGIALIEDCAQALGARVGQRFAGSVGDIGLFSFGPTKPLACLGGGAVTCRDPELARRIRARLGAGPRLAGAARLARGALFEIVTRPGPFALAKTLAARVPPHALARWLTERAGDAHRRRWQEAPMSAAEATLAQLRLDALEQTTRARLVMHGILARRTGGWPDARGGIGFGLLHVAGDPSALAHRLLALGIDAAHGELRNLGGPRCANAAAMERALMRVPVHASMSAIERDAIASALVSDPSPGSGTLGAWSRSRSTRWDRTSVRRWSSPARRR